MDSVSRLALRHRFLNLILRLPEFEILSGTCHLLSGDDVLDLWRSQPKFTSFYLLLISVYYSVYFSTFKVLRSVVLDSQYCYRTESVPLPSIFPLSSFPSNSAACPGLSRGYLGVGEQEQEKSGPKFQVLQDEQEP